MFAISTPISTPDNISSAGFVLSSVPDNYAPSVAIQNQHPVDFIIPATPEIVAGIVSVAEPTGVRVGTITIEGKVYNRSIFIPPRSGEFTQEGGLISIGYLGLVPPRAIGYYLAPISIPTNYLPPPYPDICTHFPLKGELSWSMTLEEQPNASLTFIAAASDRDAVIKYFGTPQNIDIFGVGFCPSGQLSIVDISLTKSAIPLIEVSVNLTGWHAHLLDRQIALGKQSFAPDCSAPPSAINSPLDMTVQDLAVLVGDKITGAAIYIDPDRLSAAASATTLGAELTNDVVRAIGTFVDYNNARSIELREWDSTRTWTIENVRSDIRASINNRLNAANSEAGYYKTYDPLTEIDYGSATWLVPNSSAPKPTWQPKQVEYTETVEGDINAHISPYAGVQTDLSIVFDISGKRKRFKKVTLANGQPIREVEREYGYVAVARDDMSFTNDVAPRIISLDGQWQLIESKTTDYNYDGYGYLISVRTTGVSKVRFRVENAQKPETLSLRIPGDEATLESYRFFDLPISRSEIYQLEPLSNYYSDIKKAQVNWSICLPDGSERIDIQIDDPSWIPPYFVKSKIVTESGFSSTPNPKSTALKPLPVLTTGKSSSFVERVTIGDRTNGKDPAYYTKSTDNYASSGAQFNAVLSIAESQIISGRPPVASNLGATLEQIKNQTSTYLYKGQQLVSTKPPGEKVLLDPKPTPFIVKSGLSTEDTGYVITGKLTFKTAPTAEKALRAAQVDIDIINAKNTLQETLTVDFNPDIRPGDRVIYRINGQTRTRRVISIAQKIRIDGISSGGTPFVSCAGTELKLGLDAKTPVIKTQLGLRSSTIFT